MDTDTLIKILLEKRGLKTPQQVQEFLSPTPPEELKPGSVGLDEKVINKAINLIDSHIKNDHKIAVYGDYDVDGMCSTAILWETLFNFTKNVFPHIPHRKEEGYGLSVKGIDHCLKQEAKLIIAVDNGVVAHEPINYCQSQGCDIIIIDHHEPDTTPAKPSVLVHSTQTCAAALTWIFSQQLLKFYGHPENYEQLSLVAIAIICDIIPLLGPNRSFAKFGLEKLNQTNRPGLLALFQEAGVEKGKLGPYEVGFVIGPRLNAMGRIEHAIDSLRLLCTKDPIKAFQLASVLGETNKTRQQLTQNAVEHAKSYVQAKYGDNLPSLLIVANTDYDEGIIGLVAAKLVEKFSRPAIAISIGPENSKASARSLPGFHITEAIRKYMDLLLGAGGHAMAAGFTVPTINLEKLTDYLIDTANKEINPSMLVKQHRVDAEIPLDIISFDLYDRLQQFAPFGLSNPQPLFKTPQVEIQFPKRLGKLSQHLKFKAGPYDAIAFNFESDPPSSADLIYQIDLNRWNGHESLQLIIRHVQTI